MANTIKLKRASGSDPGNSDLSVGELAIRTSNCKLFSKNDGGSAVGIVAGSADTLTTARTIAGVSFDGSGNISLNNNAITNGAGYITDLVSDTSPQLGGDLDVQSSKITTATSNGNIKIEPNGTGVVEVRGAGGEDGTLQLNCSVNSHGVKIKSPSHSNAASYTLILPTSITADRPLVTDTNGNLSWASNFVTTSGATFSGVINAFGGIELGSNDTIKFDSDDADTNHISFKGPTSLSSTVTYILPEDGSDGQFLKTNGSGTLSFASVNTDLVNDTSPQLGGYLDSNGYNIQMLDNDKLRLGTSFDLEIYHDGHNRIAGKTTGQDLYIGAEEGEIYIQTHFATNNAIVCKDNGAVELYHNGTKKFQTNANGVQSEGNFFIGDDGGGVTQRFVAGDGNDLVIYHDGSHSYVQDQGTGNLRIKGDDVEIVDNASGNNMARFIEGGAVELYHNNTKVFETTSEGVLIGNGGLHLGDNNKIEIGNNDDFQIFHDGTENQILAANGPIHTYSGANFEIRKGNSSTNEAMLKAIPNGAVELYHDNSKRFETTSYGGLMSGNLQVNTVYPSADSSYDIGTNSTRFANGYFDTLYGDGSNLTNLPASSDSTKLPLSGGELTGNLITHNVTPDGNGTRELGSSSNRWQNIYTSDLQLSNKGSSNKIDKSWGDYTIQEGINDLFLINNRSGKMYKFMLQEVS